MFANISVSQVRVRVLGTLASGAQLYQIGADAPGVAVFLGPPPTTLDLRVDSDGMVLPDPVTMIDPVPHGPAIATPAPGPDSDGRIVFPTSATYAAPACPDRGCICHHVADDLHPPHQPRTHGPTSGGERRERCACLRPPPGLGCWNQWCRRRWWWVACSLIRSRGRRRP